MRDSTDQPRLQGVTLAKSEFDGRPTLMVAMPRNSYQDPIKDVLSDRDYMIWAPVDFSDGIIEIEMVSTLAADAPNFARGFIGVAFRIDDQGRFENVYLRPTNARCDDQVRRNHTIQYCAFPDHLFLRLRKEEPEKYESYADIGLGEWIKLKVDVSGARAHVFVNSAKYPSLVVNELKLGPAQRGGLGLWIETGTIAHFASMKVNGTAVPGLNP